MAVRYNNNIISISSQIHTVKYFNDYQDESESLKVLPKKYRIL